MKALKNIDETRVKFREIDSNERLKKVRGQRINPNVERSYKIGDPVFFFDDKKKEWKKGTALVRLGKTLYLKFGNFLRRGLIMMEKSSLKKDMLNQMMMRKGLLMKKLL